MEEGVELSSAAEDAGTKGGAAVDRVDVRFCQSKQSPQDVHTAGYRCPAVAVDRRGLELGELQQLGGEGVRVMAVPLVGVTGFARVPRGVVLRDVQVIHGDVPPGGAEVVDSRSLRLLGVVIR